VNGKKLPTIADVWEAHDRIYGIVRRTPLIESPEIAEESGAAGFRLKLETLQPTGAFKVRGAANRILSLSEEERSRGVITFSTGNHGRAVSYVAQKLGIPAVICLSEHVAQYRVDKIKALGAEPYVAGSSQDEAEEHYLRIMKERNMIPVVPFDHPHIVSGQGTIGLEIAEQLPDVDVVIVPLSGGGLLAGIALAVKSLKPDVEVVGVSIEQSPAMLRSLEAGKPVQVEEKDTLADSLLGGIGQENYYTLPLIQQYVDTHVTVTEDEVANGMRCAFYQHGLVIEGAAAVPLSAVLAGKIDIRGKQTVSVISGCNVDYQQYLRVVQDTGQTDKKE